MEGLQEIVSQSGTIHFVNPKPTYRSAGLAAGRVQTLCEFHIHPDDEAPDGAKRCSFCEAAARKLGQ